MELIVVAVINGIFGSFVAYLGLKMNQSMKAMRQDVATTKDEVKNSHTKNLRLDLDEKFEEVSQNFTDMNASIDEVKSSGRTTANAVSRLRRDFSEHVRESAEHLESIYKVLDDVKG